ncbi:MAG: hypothetical protein AB7K24_01415 [Gemmataceae bacterium]
MTIIVAIVLILLGASTLIEAIRPLHPNIMALIVIAAGVMLLREAR